MKSRRIENLSLFTIKLENKSKRIENLLKQYILMKSIQIVNLFLFTITRKEE